MAEEDRSQRAQRQANAPTRRAADAMARAKDPVDDGRRALEWIRTRLDELRRKRQSKSG
jgi:hypothetical protein